MLLKFLFKKESFPSWFWFLVKTIFFYLTLKYFFIAYTGLTIEGGLYSPFVAKYLDFISLFRNFLLWGGVRFASLLGYPAYHTDFFLVIRDGAGVQLVYSCLGLDLISAYAALVVAWPSKQSYKVISLLAGTTVIILLNMARLGGLAILYTEGKYGLFDYIDHHDLFNVIVLLVVFVMFVVHVKKSERKEAIKMV